MSLAERIDSSARTRPLAPALRTAAVMPLYAVAFMLAFVLRFLWLIVLYVKGALVEGARDGWGSLR